MPAIFAQTLACIELQAQNNFEANVGNINGGAMILFNASKVKPVLLVKSTADFQSGMRMAASLQQAAYSQSHSGLAAVSKEIAVTRETRTIGGFQSMSGNLHTVVKPDYYSSNLGFFCRKELQIEKATSIPFRFRLGSLAACNAIEGK